MPKNLILAVILHCINDGRCHTCQPFRILQNLSAFESCIPHSSQNITESQILQNMIV